MSQAVTSWTDAAARHLGEGDLIRIPDGSRTLGVAAVECAPAGLVIDLVDPDSGDVVEHVSAQPDDEFLRVEPVRVTVSPDAAEHLVGVLFSDVLEERLQAGPVTLCEREAHEIIAALEEALEQPGPGAAAPVDAIEDDDRRSMARGSLAALWGDLREAAAAIDAPDIAPRRVRGLGL